MRSPLNFSFFHNPASSLRNSANVKSPGLPLPSVVVLATMLPFAVAFKLENGWIAQFPDLTPADLSTVAWGITSMHDLGGMHGFGAATWPGAEDAIHAPWEVPADEQARLGCVIGRDYPAPVVDHAQARLRTLERYAVVKGGAPG